MQRGTRIWWKDEPTLMVSEKARVSCICTSSSVLLIPTTPGPLLSKDPTASTIVASKTNSSVDALPLFLFRSLTTEPDGGGSLEQARRRRREAMMGWNSTPCWEEDHGGRRRCACHEHDRYLTSTIGAAVVMLRQRQQQVHMI